MLDKALFETEEGFEGLHHDVGFMWVPTSAASYRLTKDPASRRRALVAANYLASRWNPDGGFLTAWNSKEKEGWSIIDTMMNLSLLQKIMFLQAFLVVLPDVLNGQHGPVVGVVRVVLAEPLIGVDLGQHLNKFLFGVVDGAQELIVKLQNLHPVAVRVPLVIGGDVLIQFLFNGRDPHRLSNGLCQP